MLINQRLGRTASALGRRQHLQRRAASSLFIDGEAVGASDGARFEAISPADESSLGWLSDGSFEDADAAVMAARRAFESWSTAQKSRRDILLGAGEWIRNNVESLSNLESSDCGKPLGESRVDIEYCADIFEYYARLSVDAEKTVGSDGEVEARELSRPRGVCGLVTPWNYPLMQAVLKVAPALAAGNTIVLKPSPLASLTCVRLIHEYLGKECPRGVVNLLTGGPPTTSVERASKGLVEHPEVDFVSFTGSTRGGKAIASAAPLRPCSLELGGKGSLIVFEDSDLDLAAELAVLGIFSCAGQICSATSRLLAHQNVYRQLLNKIAEKTAALKQGHPLDPETTFGPVVSKARAKAINDMLDRESQRPMLVHGESRDSYVAARVYAHVPTDSELWRDEIFGPVLCANEFTSESEAVAMANDTKYGLASALVTWDSARADRVSRKLETGIVWTNTNQYLWPQVPFGGLAGKLSGFGREGGEAGLDEYLCKKTIVKAPHPPSYTLQHTFYRA